MLRSTFVAVLCLCSIAVAQKRQASASLDVSWSPNVETISILFELSRNGGGSREIEGIQPMRREFREFFGDFTLHPAVKSAEELIDRGFELSSMITFALSIPGVPYARMPEVPDSALCRKAGSNGDVADGKETLRLFIRGINQFYRMARVDTFLARHRSMYEGAISEVRGNLPAEKLIDAMERYYGSRPAAYTILVSPGMQRGRGFGPHIGAGDSLHAFCVLAPVVQTDDAAAYGFGYGAAEPLRDMVIHEFGHSHVNPLLGTPRAEALIAKTSYLFEPIRQAVGYGTWKTVVAEHLVRLGEVRLAHAMGERDRENRLRQTYAADMHFIYLPELEKSILTYEAQRKRYPKLANYLPKLLQTLATADTTRSIDDRLGFGPLRTVRMAVVTRRLPDTCSVFITGNQDVLGMWDPGIIRLKREADTVWSGMFRIRQKKHVEFKFTLGTWGTEALTSEGTIPANRVLDVVNDTTLAIFVSRWKNTVNR